MITLRFLEGMVALACKTLFADRNTPVRKVIRRVQAEDDGRTMEIDIFRSLEFPRTDPISLGESKAIPC